MSRKAFRSHLATSSRSPRTFAALWSIYQEWRLLICLLPFWRNLLRRELFFSLLLVFYFFSSLLQLPHSSASFCLHIESNRGFLILLLIFVFDRTRSIRVCRDDFHTISIALLSNPMEKTSHKKEIKCGDCDRPPYNKKKSRTKRCMWIYKKGSQQQKNTILNLNDRM